MRELETEALPQVLKAIDEALHAWIGKQQLIVCAGDCGGEMVLVPERESITRRDCHIHEMGYGGR